MKILQKISIPHLEAICLRSLLKSLNQYFKHAPLKELSRTEKKFRSKPWLTKGIRNSIKTKNTSYKESKKLNSPESFQRYKMFRNSLNSCEGKVQKIVLQQFI